MSADHLHGSPARRRVIDEDIAEIVKADLPWHDLESKTVLISGAAGFLAGYLVDALLALRAATGTGPGMVIGTVRNLEKARKRFATHLDRADFKLVSADVTQPPPEMGPVDFIVHAASPASPRAYLTDPVGVLRSNTEGTQHLLELARANNARFLLFSSGEVYGQAAQVPTAEGDYGLVDPMAVRSCYGESKRMAENMAVCWAHQYGLHTTVVRPFHTYGPGVALDDGRVFADFVADIVGHRDIVMRSDGHARRAFCYVGDATLGFLTVMLKGKSATAYNVGNEEAEVSIRELADRLVALFPARRLSVVVDLTERNESYAVSPISRNAPNTSRIRALGWSPRTSIDVGFRRMVESYG